MSTIATPEAHKNTPRLTDAIIVSVVVLVILSFTVRDYGLTIDEPRYINNNQRMLAWLQGLGSEPFSDSFSHAKLEQAFYYARPDSKNLPLVSYVSLGGYLIAGQFDAPIAAWRWGNLLAFAATAGLIYHWMAEFASRQSALVAVVAFVGIPRLFAHANLLAIDTLVGSLWVLGTYLLWHSTPSWRRLAMFAAVCGVGAISKPTFWFAIPVWAVWCAVFRREVLLRATCMLATVSPIVVAILCPMWLSNPVAGFIDYIHMLRNDPNAWNIDVFYLGSIYQTAPDLPVPWHSVVLLPLITTPVWILALGSIGLIREFVRRDRMDAVVLWSIGLFTIPLICALPFTPAHDGLRLYRPAFYFLPLFAGLGFQAIQDYVSPTQWPRTGRVVALFACCCIMAGYTSWRAHPAQLSYYNSLIGGLRSASDSFEVTYWWELASPTEIADMQRSMPQNARVFTYPHNTGFDLMSEWGYWRSDIKHVVPEDAQYVLIYGRYGQILNPGGSGTIARLFLTGRPIWEQRVDGVRTMALFQIRANASDAQ